jgi:hypothetical protein
VSQRARNDTAVEEMQLVKAQGIPRTSSTKVSMYETRFEAKGSVGCCYASCWVDQSMSLGFMTLWQGSVVVWLAPAHLMAVAEEAVKRMHASFRITPKLYQLAQRDETIIASSGMAANMNLWRGRK